MICAGRPGGNQDTCQVNIARLNGLILIINFHLFFSVKRVIQVVHSHGETQPMVYGILSVLQVGVLVVVILEFTHVFLHTQVYNLNI